MLVCYFHVYLIFCSLAISDWKSAKDHLSKLDLTINDLEISLRGTLENFRTYLSALYLQSIGDLENALREFKDARLHLPDESNLVTEPEQQIQYDLSLLSSMNVISILQNDHYHDIAQNNTMVANLEPLCLKHSNKDIQTAFKLLKALVLTDPPAGITRTKNYLSSALDTAKATANKQFICIALSTLYSKFFVGHAGDQSEKAVRAAVQQAKSARNPLWMSVASGMLASNLELQGKSEEAQATKMEASRLSALAFPKPS
jgi:tetratricopeptide (TPR) repeat protein